VVRLLAWIVPDWKFPTCRLIFPHMMVIAVTRSCSGGGGGSVGPPAVSLGGICFVDRPKWDAARRFFRRSSLHPATCRTVGGFVGDPLLSGLSDDPFDFCFYFPRCSSTRAAEVSSTSRAGTLLGVLSGR
jgi:hypothetical protein